MDGEHHLGPPQAVVVVLLPAEREPLQEPNICFDGPQVLRYYVDGSEIATTFRLCVRPVPWSGHEVMREHAFKRKGWRGHSRSAAAGSRPYISYGSCSYGDASSIPSGLSRCFCNRRCHHKARMVGPQLRSKADHRRPLTGMWPSCGSACTQAADHTHTEQKHQAQEGCTAACMWRRFF